MPVNGGRRHVRWKMVDRSKNPTNLGILSLIYNGSKMRRGGEVCWKTFPKTEKNSRRFLFLSSLIEYFQKAPLPNTYQKPNLEMSVKHKTTRKYPRKLPSETSVTSLMPWSVPGETATPGSSRVLQTKVSVLTST